MRVLLLSNQKILHKYDEVSSLAKNNAICIFNFFKTETKIYY